MAIDVRQRLARGACVCNRKRQETIGGATAAGCARAGQMRSGAWRKAPQRVPAGWHKVRHAIARLQGGLLWKSWPIRL